MNSNNERKTIFSVEKKAGGKVSIIIPERLFKAAWKTIVGFIAAILGGGGFAAVRHFLM